MPLASQSLEYILMEVNPGMVLSSFTIISSPGEKSTLAIPHKRARKA